MRNARLLPGRSQHPDGNAEMAKRAEPARVWQRMLSGRRLDLLDPSPLDVEIVDIAHGLARVARWNGQTIGPHIFSVAQHSVLVEHHRYIYLTTSSLFVRDLSRGEYKLTY